VYIIQVITIFCVLTLKNAYHPRFFLKEYIIQVISTFVC